MVLEKLRESYGAVRQVLADPRRKTVARMVREIASVTLHTRDHPQKYLSAFAYRLDAGHHLSFLARKEILAIQRRLQRREHTAVLDDKLLFHEHFSSTSITLPRLLAYNDGEDFSVDGTRMRVEDGPAFARLVDRLRARARTGAVFVKPATGKKGQGCARIDAGSDPAALHGRVTSGRFLFQEAVEQHEAVSAIYPYSVNTVRVLTCVAADRRPVVLAALLRLGTGQRYVDNASAGGIFVGIDLATGRLLREAKQFFQFGGQVHSTHPDTGFRFDGFELPHFQAVLAAAVAAATQLPQELVGWDFAIAPDGPVLIEGNSGAHLTLVEIAYGDGLLAHPVFQSILGTLGPGRRRNVGFAGTPSAAWRTSSAPSGPAGVEGYVGPGQGRTL